MRSWYDLMVDSSEYDTDLQKFPDPLSVNFSAFTFTEPPYQYEIDERFINKPYITMQALYSSPELEDVIFNINNISHISTLQEVTGTGLLSLPSSADLQGFLKVQSKTKW